MSTESPVVLSVTVILPLSSALTSLFGLDFLTSSTNFSISFDVKCSGSGTTSGSGISTSNSFAGSPLALVSFAGTSTSLAVFGSLPDSCTFGVSVFFASGNLSFGTVTVPPVTG